MHGSLYERSKLTELVILVDSTLTAGTQPVEPATDARTAFRRWPAELDLVAPQRRPYARVV